MQTRSLGAVLVAVCLLSSGPSVVPAQCGTQWLPGAGIPGTDGEVRATTLWDPDGAGPLGPRVVIGGLFRTAGDVAAENIAAWDPSTRNWSALGTGTSSTSFGTVHALAVLPNGDLVAAGDFTAAGGVPANFVARWDGTSWSPLGAGTNAGVRRLAVLPNGDLVAAGAFTLAGGAPANRLARWDGAAWSEFGGGVQGLVDAMAVMPNGDLVISGSFGVVGGVAAPWIARWNGTTWSTLGALNGPGTALAVMPNGDLVAGGGFTTGSGGPADGLARWNGSSWSPIGSLSWLSVDALAVLPNGDLVVGGGNLQGWTVARWDGATFSPYPSGSTFVTVRSITVLGPLDFVVGGSTAAAGAPDVGGVQRWNGTAWSLLTQVDGWSVAGGSVHAMVRQANGDLAIAGSFRMVAGVPADRVARWNGSALAPMGNGLPGVARALATLPNGDLVAGGSYLPGTGMTAGYLHRWTGTTWVPLAGSFAVTLSGSSVEALATMPDGDLVAAGTFTAVDTVGANGIARWDGVGWTPLGSGMNDTVETLAVHADGDLVAGGWFTTAGGVPASRIARWNGVAWAPLGAGVDGLVSCLLALPDGDLIAGGSFTTAGGGAAANIARWDGAAWSPLGAGVGGWVTGLFALPDGDIVAAGSFTTAGGGPAAGLARWNGSAWSSMGAPFAPGSLVDPVASAIAMTSDGELVVGGGFRSTSAPIPPRLARLASTCPAASAAAGVGCASSGGGNSLVAVTLPWLDATFRSRASGLPSLAIAATLLSFSSIAQGTAPLASVFAQAPPGCDLLVVPDVLGLVVADAGVADYAAHLPDTPALVGLTFFHQMVPFELDLGGNFVAITATNALRLTTGIF